MKFGIYYTVIFPSETIPLSGTVRIRGKRLETGPHLEGGSEIPIAPQGARPTVGSSLLYLAPSSLFDIYIYIYTCIICM